MLDRDLSDLNTISRFSPVSSSFITGKLPSNIPLSPFATEDGHDASNRLRLTISNELKVPRVNSSEPGILSSQSTGADQIIPEPENFEKNFAFSEDSKSDSKATQYADIGIQGFANIHSSKLDEHTILIDEEDEEFTNNGLSIHYLPKEVKLEKFSFYRQPLLSQVWEPQYTETKKETFNDRLPSNQTSKNRDGIHSNNPNNKQIIRINVNSRTTLTPALSALLLKFLLTSSDTNCAPIKRNSTVAHHPNISGSPTSPDFREYPGKIYKDSTFEFSTNNVEVPSELNTSATINDVDSALIHNAFLTGQSSSISTINSVKPRTRSIASFSSTLDMELIRSQFLTTMLEQSPKDDSHSDIREGDSHSFSIGVQEFGNPTDSRIAGNPNKKISIGYSGSKSLPQSHLHTTSGSNVPFSKTNKRVSSPAPVKKASLTMLLTSVPDAMPELEAHLDFPTPPNILTDIPEKLRHNLSFYRSSPPVAGTVILTKNTVAPNISIPAIVPPLGLYCHTPNILGSPPPAIYGHSSTKYNNEIYIFGGKRSSEYRNDLFIFDCISRTLRFQITTGDTPPPMVGMASVAMGGYIIYSGGSCGANYSNDIYALNQADNRFTKLNFKQSNESLPEPRRGHSMIIYKDSRKQFKQSVIIFGGMNEEKVFNDVWRLDINLLDLNESKFTKIPQKEDTFTLFSSNNKSITSETHETSNQLWPSRRCYHTAIMVQTSYTDLHKCSKMLVYGGSDGSAEIHSDVWLFDPFSEKWSVFPTYKNDKVTKAPTPFSLPRVMHVTVHDGTGKWVIISGGFDGSRLVTDVWKVSLSTGVWVECPYYGVLDRGKFAHTCEYYDGRCYFIGGANLSLTAFSEIRVMDAPFSGVQERFKL
ncbi:galactose oxidase [Nadsonia fulvescens var. elongata DSM 6958]|uniref:Galactose oxidase n=1 Tax=Nadsonia fulvescens var. elongata DSM 6958 TaxID=857566 RepID=A0A1E3PHY7_9ASCO|nr:galactose oxidase [Nadsonia fulvescens var. elongata DSM 6958]